MGAGHKHKDSRTLERLGNWTPAARRRKGRRIRFYEGHRSRAGLCRWLAECRAGIDTGRRDGARQTIYSEIARGESESGTYLLLPRADREGRRRLRCRVEGSRDRKCQVSARPCCLEPGSTAPVPEAKLQRIDRSSEEGRGCRSGG